jgi:hypothetical protein
MCAYTCRGLSQSACGGYIPVAFDEDHFSFADLFIIKCEPTCPCKKKLILLIGALFVTLISALTRVWTPSGAHFPEFGSVLQVWPTSSNFSIVKPEHILSIRVYFSPRE